MPCSCARFGSNRRSAPLSSYACRTTTTTGAFRTAALFLPACCTFSATTTCLHLLLRSSSTAVATMHTPPYRIVHLRTAPPYNGSGRAFLSVFTCCGRLTLTFHVGFTAAAVRAPAPLFYRCSCVGMGTICFPTTRFRRTFARRRLRSLYACCLHRDLLPLPPTTIYGRLPFHTLGLYWFAVAYVLFCLRPRLPPALKPAFYATMPAILFFVRHASTTCLPPFPKTELTHTACLTLPHHHPHLPSVPPHTGCHHFTTTPLPTTATHHTHHHLRFPFPVLLYFCVRCSACIKFPSLYTIPPLPLFFHDN